MIWFRVVVTSATGTHRHAEELPGSTDPAASPRSSRPVIPDRPCGAPLDPPQFRCVVRAPAPAWKEPVMAAQPKPENVDEAREAARRALQTSMDTRQ